MTKSLVVRWTDGAEYAEDRYPFDTEWKFHTHDVIVLIHPAGPTIASYFIRWLISIRIEEDPTK